MPVLDFFLNDISPVTKNLRFDIGATLPVLRVRVMDGNDPVSLAGGTATFTMRDKDGIAKILNAAAIIEGDGTSGIVRYEWNVVDTNDARIFFAQFTITIAGEDLIVPNDADQVLRIVIGKSDFQRGTVIQQPISQGVQVVALGGTPVLDAISRIFKVAVTEAAFTAAAAEEAIDLFQLPAGAIIQAMKIKHSVAFVGGGISAYTLGVGIAALPQKYLTDFDVFSAPTSTNDKVATSGDEESHDAATPIKVTAKATGGDVADATVGDVEIWVIAVNTLSAGSAVTISGLEVQKDGVTVAGGPFSLMDFQGVTDVLKVSDGRARVIVPSAIVLLGATSLAIYSDNLPGGVTEANLGSKSIDIQADRTLATQIVAGAESIGLGVRVTVDGDDAVGIGKDVTIAAAHDRSVAIGVDAVTSGADQIMLGTSARTVVTPGKLQVLTMQDEDSMVALDLGVSASTARLLKDTGGTIVINFESDGTTLRLLSGSNVALDWAARILKDQGGSDILDWSKSAGDALHVKSTPLALDDVTDPGSVPVGSVIIFAESGILKARTSSGVTTLAT